VIKMTEPRFLTLSQASELLNVGLAYIYRLSAEGRLPGKIVLGARTIRVDRERLLAFMEAQMDQEPDDE